jgi:hypothetical protein
MLVEYVSKEGIYLTKIDTIELQRHFGDKKTEILTITGETKVDGQTQTVKASCAVANRNGEPFFKTDPTYYSALYFAFTQNPVYKEIKTVNNEKGGYKLFEIVPAQGDKFNTINVAISIERIVYSDRETGTPKAIDKQVLERVFDNQNRTLIEAKENLEAKRYLDMRLKDSFGRGTNPDEYWAIKSMNGSGSEINTEDNKSNSNEPIAEINDEISEFDNSGEVPF